MSTNIIQMRGAKEAPRSARSKMETILVTPEVLKDWVLPGFQRDLRENEKVRALSEQLIKEGGVIPGVLTLGTLSGEKLTYILDGQHRRHAALISGLLEFIADVRICQFDTLADMGEEYVLLNSSLVAMRPDDILRGLEGSILAIRKIREACPFVGYEQVRRGAKTGSPALLSMSAVLRCWRISSRETPSGGSGGSAINMARSLEKDEVLALTEFLNIAKSAWGSDPEYYRLWGSLNLTMCMWIYHQLVLRRERGVKRYVVLNSDEFKKCLMAVSAATEYVDWLLGRVAGERDRSPCYARIKAIFVARLKQFPNKTDRMPVPAWASK
jgi:hypothetical protein